MRVSSLDDECDMYVFIHNNYTSLNTEKFCAVFVRDLKHTSS